MSQHNVDVALMGFIERVIAWYIQGIESVGSIEFLIANEMMYVAFDERGTAPNIFSSRLSGCASMGDIYSRFAETLESHQEILSRIVYDENVDGGAIANLLPQIALTISEFYRVLDENDAIALWIFLCRYAVLSYERGIYDAPMFITAVVAGMC